MTTRLGRSAPSRAESGTTLIELLVTVVIMGIAFVIIVGGIGTAIIGSEVQKNQAGADVALRTAAESLAYEPCPASYTPDQPNGFVVTVLEVAYWDPGTNKFVRGDCLDHGLHLIKLSASSTSGRHATKSLAVVKRRP